MSAYTLPAPRWGDESDNIEDAELISQPSRTCVTQRGALVTQSSALSPYISVIIPTYNEAPNLPHVLARIPATVGEIVLVDGDSHDDTVAVAQMLRPDVVVVHQQKRGKGDAIRCGLAATHGDIIVLLDADGSTDPQEIEEFVAPLLAGADYVKGSRFAARGGSADITRIRRWGNAALSGLVNLLFGANFTDLCYGYNAFWRDCLECFTMDCDGFEVETQLNLRAHKANLRIVETPSYEHLRMHGESNLHAIRDGWRVLKMIVQEWRDGRAVVTDRRYVIGSALRERLLGSALADPAQELVAVEAPITLAGLVVAEDAALPYGLALEAESDARVADARVADVTVVIAAYTHQRWSELARGIRSVQRQTLMPAEILLVIDHNPALAALARDAFPEVIVLENSGERGLSPTRNLGVLTARGTYIAFLDDDAAADPEWLATLMRVGAHELALGVGSAIVPAWRTERPHWFPEEFEWVIGCGYRGLPQRLAPIRNLIGASMLIRREVFDTVGGFRAELGRVGAHPVGCEETELCVRARQRWPHRTFLYEPRACVSHAVPAHRATLSYFRRRCYHEGRSKAQMAQLIGARDGLASEWTYTLQTLPLGIARNLWSVFAQRDLSGIARALAIIFGLALTTLGYLSITLSEPFKPFKPFKFFMTRSQHV